MGKWMNVRLILHKYNSYLLYGMCGLIFTTQLAMVYVHKTGGEARGTVAGVLGVAVRHEETSINSDNLSLVRPEDIFKKGEYVEKIEGFIEKFSKIGRKDPFEPTKDELKKKASRDSKNKSSTG